MPRDFIPSSDAEFRLWAQNFSTYVAANFVALGLVLDDSDGLGAVVIDFANAHDALLAAKAAAQGAREVKDATRAIAVEQIRTLVRRLQASTIVSDEERQNLGITVRSTEREPLPAPLTRPIPVIDAGQRLRHIIRYTDEATPLSRARPVGAIGCEIGVKLGGPPPIDASELTVLALHPRSPFTTEYPGTRANTSAHYMLRWVGTRGDKGPWSSTLTATVGG